MHRYRAYGLAIASKEHLPELIPADFAVADVTIRRQRLGRRLPKSRPALFEFRSREAYLAWSKVGAFLVEDGKTILADLPPTTPDALARLPLLGMVLAVLLHQRGLLVLHANAVAVANRATIFMGTKGAGKSTMAAALLARGHRLIADDVVAVDCTNGSVPELISGYPQLKLSLNAATTVLGEQRDALPPVHQRFEKRCCRIGRDRFADGSMSPGRIYALAKAPDYADTAMAPQEALTTLLQHSYMARFGSQVLHGAAADAHLRQCVALANHAPVRRLEVPSALHDLDHAAHLIEAGSARAASSATVQPRPAPPSPCRVDCDGRQR